MSKQKILNFIQKQSKVEGFKLKLYKSYKAKYKGEEFSSGYYQSKNIYNIKNSVLAVGTKKKTKDWLCVLLHEYCHFTQDRDQCKEWVKYAKEFKNAKDGAKDYILALMDLEYDCEKRTIQLIKDLGIENYIDAQQYAKTANAYLTFYNVYLKTNRWYCTAPYDVKEVLERMPSTLKKPNQLKSNYEMIGLIVDKCYTKNYKWM